MEVCFRIISISHSFSFPFLFVLLFLWQLPHFLAINWIYRDEYRKGGFVMWANEDESGGITAGRSLFFAIATLLLMIYPVAQGVVASWEESGDADEFAVGFGLEGSVEVALDETWSLIGTAGYEIIDTVEVDVGPSKVEIDFSGYVLSLMLGTTF